MLLNCFKKGRIEVGCDEAGRGSLAGPVYAAAVILPKSFYHPLLDDSKKLTEQASDLLRPVIERKALDWAVAFVDNQEIDDINILNASIEAMHRALDKLNICPDALLIDGNKFKQYKDITHHTIVNGDATYKSIAAASILAKTHRDEYMQKLHNEFPQYGWDQNKAYPTPQHRQAIRKYGITIYHRKSYHLVKSHEVLEF